MKKSIFTLLLPIAMAGAAHAEVLHHFVLPNGGYVEAMSDNGKWGLSNAPADSETDAYIHRMNLITGELERLPLILSQTPENTDGNEYKARNYDITDDGKMIVGSINGRAGYYDLDTEQWYNFKVPSGARSWEGEAKACTPDGRVVIGTLYSGMTKFKPVLWVNKELQVIDTSKFPTYDEMYDLGIIDPQTYDEHISKGDTPNVSFMQISSDGKHILAGVDHNYPSWGASRIIFHVDTQTYDWIRNDEVQGQNFVDAAYMSNNGKYVCGYVNMIVDDVEAFVPYTYIVDTKEFKLGKRGDIVGDIIDNEGNIYLSRGEAPIYNWYVPTNGLLVGIDRILKQKYDFDIYTQTTLTQSGYPRHISDDMKTVLCQGEMRTEVYSITLPEKISEAGKGVNLLTDFAVLPVENTEIARLRTVAVQMSYAAKHDTALKPWLEEAGTKVAEAKEVKVSAASSSIYGITFDDVVIPAGKRYTLVIPAGTFYVEGTEFKNPELRVDYLGREEVPVNVVKIDPQDGAAIREFSEKNPIHLTFNTPVTAAQKFSAAIYQEGSDKIFTSVSYAVDGKKVTLFPPASRMFKAGVKYELRIPAASFTDPQGFCASQEMKYTFEGSYTPTVTEFDGSHLFFEDFSNPNDALNKFLLYEGDHLTPHEQMSALGFDADNTPWNFSTLDDKSSTDYYATSHSVYEYPGKSDDWMVIPQLSISNPKAYLSFDAQSFLASKRDYLKVIVYESDEYYGSLDDIIVEDMKANGKVVFNELLDPGANEETTLGDWTRYTVDLSAYNGKKIYIAFVNDNENQSSVFVDNIDVYYETGFTAYNTTPTSVVALSELEVSGAVKSNRVEPYKKLTATLRTKEGVEISTYSADINLEKDQTFEYKFPVKADINIGQINTLEVEVHLDAEAQNYLIYVRDLTDSFQQNVLIEEGTGLWCQACPQGILAIEHLQQAFPGQIIPVAVHQGNDRYAWNEYSNFLGFNAFPSARINRLPNITFPMLNGSFDGTAEDPTWKTQVIDQLRYPAETRVVMQEAYSYAGTQDIGVIFDLEFALDKKNIYYNLFVVSVEDGLTGKQLNGLRYMTEPIYGDWGANGKYGQAALEDPQGYVRIDLEHVARNKAGESYYGISNLVPREVNAGEPYKFKVEYTADNMRDPENTTIVVAVVDAADGKIVNCASLHGLAAKNSVQGVEAETVRFSIAEGTARANGSTEGVEVYTIDGRRVANAGLNGLYIVKAHGKTAKIMAH